MDWREFLEKDALDGKGANDKIKPANWVANNSDEKTENWTYMKPEDFSDIAHSEAHDDAHKIPKRPLEYSPENKPRKWKTPKHGTIHTGQEKKPATAEGEKNSKGNDMNYNRRGDELGSIERYQNKLRHGEPIPAPSLGVSGGGKGKKRQAHGHEGRHRAEAATREGEKTIPVGIGHSALRTGGEKKLTSRQVASLRGENTMIGQSERSIRQNVKDGIQSLKSWESWLEKDSLDGKQSAGGLPKGSKNSGLTPKQRKIQQSIDKENDSDNQYYFTKAWESWLEKKNRTINDDFPKGKPPHIDYNKTPDKTIPRTRSDFDDETHEDPYVNNSISSVDLWESWLEKACKGGNCGDRKMWEAFRTHHNENKDRKRSKEDLDIFDSNIIIHDNNGAGSKELKNTNSGRRLNDRIRTTTPKAGAKRNQIDVELAHEMKSWEVWLEKNNAIETSHKEGEKKEEWNGKFDNSTTRDDAENDDDKAIGEEESLEELTDGKLEEVEKLKAWEVFLEKNQYPTDNRKEITDKDGDTIIDESGTQLQTSGETGQATLTSDDNRDMENENTSNNLTTRYGKGGAGRIAQNTGAGGRGRQGGNKRGGSVKTPQGQNISHDGSEYNESTGDYNATQFGTDRILARFKEEDRVAKLKPKKPSSPNAVNSKQPSSKDDYALHDTEDVGRKVTAGMQSLKSWESWLEKKTTKESNVGIRNGIPHPAARTANEIEASAQQAASTGDVNIGTLNADMKKKKSWEAWIEKMQGAGDARYGNQHLTGLDQKPVDNEEDEANILPEKEEKTDDKEEKQEKTEDKEDKDNKPYKA